MTTVNYIIYISLSLLYDLSLSLHDHRYPYYIYTVFVYCYIYSMLATMRYKTGEGSVHFLLLLGVFIGDRAGKSAIYIITANEYCLL